MVVSPVTAYGKVPNEVSCGNKINDAVLSTRKIKFIYQLHIYEIKKFKDKFTDIYSIYNFICILF